MLGYQYVGDDPDKEGTFVPLDHELSRYENSNWEKVYRTESDAQEAPPEAGGDLLGSFTVADLDKIIDHAGLSVSSKLNKADKAVAILEALIPTDDDSTDDESDDDGSGDAGDGAKDD